MQGQKDRKRMESTAKLDMLLPGEANVRTKGNWIVSERDLLGKSKTKQKVT